MDNYIYLISYGEYSSYSVNALMLSDKRLNKEELKNLELEAERICTQLENPHDFDIEKFLRDKGFRVFYPTGEFWRHYQGFSFSDDIKQNEENAFIVHLG
jgi:hypothetical protein